MLHHRGRADPPLSLKGRLAQLRRRLESLADDLKSSLARLVADAVAEAAEDCFRRILGGPERPERTRDRPAWGRPGSPPSWQEPGDDLWDQPDENSWMEGPYHLTESPDTGGPEPGEVRWLPAAMSMAVKGTLWWLALRAKRSP